MGKSKREPVGLKDIADKAGISVMSVSRALRGAKGVSTETRDSITKLAEEMGYVRNTLAGSLVHGVTKTIGVLVPDLAPSLFHKVIQVIESVMGEHEYTLILFCSYDEPEREARQVLALLERRVDGIILAPASSKYSRATIERIQQSGCPVVLIDRLVQGIDAHSVTFNDFEGACEIVSHLIHQGYERIAHIGGPPNVWTADERLRGYLETLKSNGMKIRNEYILRSGFRVEHGTALAEQMLNLKTRPDAIFCVNDPTAMGAMKFFLKHGIKVPDDIALAGFSDTMYAEMLKVPLTTMVQDADMMGRQVANMMLSLLQNPNWSRQKPSHQEFNTHIVIRKSSLRKRKPAPASK